jgi:TetR/AcrR family transcriptional regulator, transcriptional repressor for nem operon
VARPREFDVDIALGRAMEVFWTKGYEATSLDDLCEATGLSRSSLYAAFGDKRDMLFKSLDLYVERRAARIGQVLQRPPFRAALAALLRELIDGIVAGPGRRGCFIGNCAAELARQDRNAMARVRRSLLQNQETIRAALLQARSRGEIARNADLDALASFLISSLQGLRLVGKANPDRVALEDIAAMILRCLDT